MYKMTRTNYEDMLASQGGGCAVCSTAACGSGMRFCVDHDHSCCRTVPTCGNCNRGLLCHSCNRAIGLLGDSPVLLIKALAYLKGGSRPDDRVELTE
ncbi:endonuclease domain-containing protein [Streptomyces sp. NPDC093586]|uniref:endonuclease domain-containing protein n=1 Tax=Streptomyces sp. NPDC093586 TaxID=3366042 RepID=UPI0038264FC7